MCILTVLFSMFVVISCVFVLQQHMQDASSLARFIIVGVAIGHILQIAHISTGYPAAIHEFLLAVIAAVLLSSRLIWHKADIWESLSCNKKKENPTPYY